MKTIKPINQTELFGLESYLNKFIQLYDKNILPNKILLSGQKGIGKSTLAYHFINYVLSKNEEFKYDTQYLKINANNHTYKTILNRSNPNFYLLDIDIEKKSIDINQIRKLISNLNKSSFNKKPRFVLIDNIEFMNVNSINALLKVLEEPSENVYFILINNNKKILPTLSSRCVNFKISLSNNQSLFIAQKLCKDNLDHLINEDLINYYVTPGAIYNLIIFADLNEYDLSNFTLFELISVIIKKNHYKKYDEIKYLIYDFMEFYFRKLNSTISLDIYDKYSYFINRISETKRFNLDEEILFIEFEQKILNG